MTIQRAFSKIYLLAGISAAGLMAPTALHAQDMPPSEEAEQAGISDIVVTAQRRSEKLNDVGISVIAATGDTLLARGVASTQDLTKIVPGLTVAETANGNPVLTLRGVGFVESSFAASSPVPIYQDEIPLPNSMMAAGTSLDVQRVEVLKGPQGTLYGQNSTGGAANFVANKPTDELHAGFDASLGRFMDTDLQGYVSGPLGDNIRARLALRTHQSGDWQKSVSRADTLGATHITMGRLLVDVDVSENLTFELNLNGFIDKSDVQAVAATALFPRGPVVEPQASTLLTPPGNARLADWDEDKDFGRDNSYYMAALKTSLSLGNSNQIISQTAYQQFKQDMLVEPDGTSCECANTQIDGYIKTFSQELRLQGDSGPLKYVLGGNYSHDKVFENNLYIVGESSQAGGAFRIAQARSNQTADTYAVFANVDYEVASGLNLQGGIRYTKQERDFIGCLADPGIDGGRFGALFGQPAGACVTLDSNFQSGIVDLDLSETNVTWRAAVNFKPAPGKLIYASVSRGFKQGSFPNLGATFDFLYEPATQESVYAYEVGTKLSLADRLIQLNGSVFYYDYSDKQLRGKFVDPNLGTIEKLINIPESRVFGAEIEFVANPVDGLTLSANVTYADSKIKSDFPALSPVGAPINLQGETFENSPKWAATGSIAYDTPISTSVNGFAGVDVNYQSATHGGYGGNPVFAIAPYTLVDLRAGVRNSDDKWRAQLWVRNLTNKYYWTNANYLGEYAYRQTGKPRTFGVSISYRY